MAEKDWIIPELKQGRAEPETNLKNLTIEGYTKAWENFDRSYKGAWNDFIEEYGTKYDKNGYKIKPTEGLKGWNKDLAPRNTSVEVRANRESVLNFIFEGDTTDITKAVSYTHLTLPTTPYV